MDLSYGTLLALVANMAKGIADQFIRDITGADDSSRTEPRVVLVRSSRGIKQFITAALSEVEALVLDGKDSVARWDLMAFGFERLAELADQHEQHNVFVAARDVSKLAHYAKEQAGAQSSALRKAYNDFVTHLSTMLLRVYIEGGDEKCVWELAGVEVLITQSYRQLSLEERRLVEASHWVN